MRLSRLTLCVLFLVSVMAITSGCSTTATELFSQSTPVSTQAVLEGGSKSYTDTVTNTVSLYYDGTVSFLTDECGVGGYSVAAGKAVMYGVVGGVWGVSEAALHGALRADTIEGVVIAAAVGSGIGLIGGMKRAYDDFETDIARCRSNS